MIQGLSQDIGSIAANDTGGASYWRGKIRAVSLKRKSRVPFLSRFGVFSPTPRKIMLKEASRADISRILCHYADFAVQFKDVWDSVRKPLFVHVHGYDATFNLKLHDNPSKNFHPASYPDDIRRLAKRAKLIANSNFTKKILMDGGIEESNIEVKYFGVPIPDSANMHKRTRGVNILHIGRLVDFKSPDRTINAFEIASKKGLDGYLTIIGDGPMRAACELLRLRSQFSERISILGAMPHEQAVKFLRDADIFTQHNVTGELTGQNECFGVSIVEAMSYGIPVVGTKSGAVPETVLDSVTGILVEPKNAEAQAEALLNLAFDPERRRTMGEAGRNRIAKLFSPESEIKRLHEIMGIEDLNVH
jgi:glycosyltransferase involved in cell wall biosynthesis